MAGETPGAHEHQKKRRAVSTQSGNPAYKSDRVSAIGNQVGLEGSRNKAEVKVAKRAADPRSTDQYYANPRDATAAKSKAAQPTRTNAPSAAHPDELWVTEKEDVAAVVNWLKQSEPNVQRVVYVQTGRRDLMQRLRAALDQAVTSEQINEDHYRDFVLRYGESTKEAVKAPPPVPGEGKPVEEAAGVDVSEFEHLNELTEKPFTLDDEPFPPEDEDDGSDPIEPRAADTPPEPTPEDKPKDKEPGMMDAPVPATEPAPEAASPETTPPTSEAGVEQTTAPMGDVEEAAGAGTTPEQSRRGKKNRR